MPLRTRIGVILAVLALTSCGGKSSPTQPSNPTPTQTTWNLSGTVTSSQDGAGVSGATARIGDGPNAGKSTTTDGSGHYNFIGLMQSGFTVNFSASNFNNASSGVDLTANRTLDVRLDPIPLFSRSGVGDNVFDIPTTVRRIRITGDYSQCSSNFIVHIAGAHIVNELLGTCWGQVHFDGTYVTSGGTVEILSSSGVRWTFTEVR